jgi:FtsZ-binding cell division protein ZapB
VTEDALERLGELEAAVRRAVDALTRLGEENERLRREVARLGAERKQVVAQMDAILEDIGKLEL